MENELIIVFDGLCNFCNSTVQFIIKKDTQNKFKFAAIQTRTGHELLQKHGITVSTLDTIVLLKKGIVYLRSDAALQIAKELDKPWKVLAIFKITPKFVRDSLYDFFAKHRYYWFGKRDECVIPTQELRQRFLNNDTHR
jgi:predicted DCC family thiol-disulfide oxidoreductase YuxK